MINPGIFFKRIWSDDDCIELEVTTSDGLSLFCTKVYVGHANFDKVIIDLERFRTQIHGGIYDMRFGEFGPELASGAIHARMHFAKSGRGKLFITVKTESAWHDFSLNKVASSATLYFTTEPASLDRFIEELRELQSATEEEAALRAEKV